MPGFEQALMSILGGGGGIGNPVMGALQMGIGISQIVKGKKQEKEAKNMRKNTVRPIKKIEQGYKDNLNLTENRASQGLSDAAMTVYENNMNRGLTTSIDAILRGAGDINTVADVYDSAEDNFAQLALLEEEVRQKNTQNYLLASEAYAEKENEGWVINEWGPYRDRMQAIAELRTQSQQNRNNGLNLMGQAIGNMFISQAGNKEANNVFGAKPDVPDARADNRVNYIPVPSAPRPGSFVGTIVPPRNIIGSQPATNGTGYTDWAELGRRLFPMTTH